MFASTVRRLTVYIALVQVVLYVLVAAVVWVFVTLVDPAENFGGQGQNDSNSGTVYGTLGLVFLVGLVSVTVLSPLVGFVIARRALAPVQAGYESQQQFVDNAAHELRTPMTVIRAESEVALMRERSVVEYRAALRKISASSDELIDLTEALLLLARGDAGHLQESYTILDLTELTRSVITEAAANLTVGFLTEAPPVLVSGSRVLLGRAIRNLVDNANRHGGGIARIEVHSSGPWGVVQISDAGPGMSPEALASARTRFWRADASRTTPGTGLGLAIVTEIAAIHHGHFDLGSTPGQGTRAALRLPLSR